MSQSPRPLKLGNQITQTGACHPENVSFTYHFHFDFDYYGFPPTLHILRPSTVPELIDWMNDAALRMDQTLGIQR